MEMKTITDIQRLFFKREGKVLLGKHGSNFIILTAVLTFAILSIAFAKSSRAYLKVRMEDPFVTLVDIVAEQGDAHRSMTLVDFLDNSNIQEECSFSNPIPTYTTSRYFYSKDLDNDFQLQGRSYDINASIFDKIISSRNVIVRKQMEIANESFGIIVTADVVKELGYSLDSIPDYIYVAQPTDIDQCVELHFNQINEYIPIAIPILAVVRDIPGVEYSFMYSKELHNAWEDGGVWNVLEKNYNTSLCIFGDTDALQVITSKLDTEIPIKSYFEPEINSWNSNCGYLVISQDSLVEEEETILLNDLFNKIHQSYPNIVRIYHFMSEYSFDDYIPIYSVEVTDLKNVRILQNMLKEKCGIRLDMRSIESQENFYYVEFMSSALSWSIVGIALIFIFVLIYYMLFTHFQQIQKNLGTFKAFGFSNKTLYLIYFILIISNVIAAFLISFGGLAVVQIILYLSHVGIVYEEMIFPYFNVFISHSIYLLLIVIVVATLSTICVAYNKLHHTPGDLIYNRNQN